MLNHSDKQSNYRFMKRLALLLCASFLCFVGSTFLSAGSEHSPLGLAVYAEGEEPFETEDPEEKKLVITVVESREAMEIEENEIPLAANPATQNRAGTRHALLACVLLLCSLIYTLYTIVTERRLYRLRIKAADAEYALMKQKDPNQ